MDDTLFPPNCQNLTDGVIGPVIQRLPPFHSFVSVDTRPPASELTKKENEIEQRRIQNRLHQARFQMRQQQKMANLEEDVKQLQKELQRLDAQRNVLVAGVSTKTIWHVAAEYFRLFQNGYSNGYGVDTILQHWKDFSFVFEGIGIELVSLERCAEGGVLASVRSVATLSDKTISYAFPHLIRDGEMSLMAAKLQGQRIEMRGWVHFQWSDDVERVDSVRYNVDILTPIMQLLHDLEGTARVFNNANITPESKLVAT
ncbi:hypothetical protein V7S43_001504 [Phytophthora oleae]|uniref:BZIP domain-containing protein n=1 Tax=Phytophthora oleae TaxID=2107226 RepID=A0ABD3G5T9_9STRA